MNFPDSTPQKHFVDILGIKLSHPVGHDTIVLCSYNNVRKAD
jgi:hypothetical protein